MVAVTSKPFILKKRGYQVFSPLFGRAAETVVLRQTVNLVPQGKHWGFESLPSH